LELKTVLPRWSTVFMIWFGLLVGMASPAIACAAAARHGDCCPQGSTSPCGEEKGAHQWGSSATCCVNAPAPSAVSVDVNRNTPQPQHDSGSPDPIVAFAWLATLSSHVRAPQVVVPVISLPRTDAALTWLRTGRLRL